MRLRRAPHLVLIGVLIAGCGGDDDLEVTPADPADAADGEEAPDGDVATDAEPAAGTDDVAIVDDDGRRFDPAEVSVEVGDSVTWTHEGSLPHTVTASDGAFDSGDLAGGETFSFTTEEPGTIGYACSIHPDMTGTITVS